MTNPMSQVGELMEALRDGLNEPETEAGGLGEGLKNFLRAFAKFLGDPRLKQVIDFLSALLAEKPAPASSAPGGAA